GVLDAPAARALAHRLAHQRLGAAEEALPVGETFPSWIEAAIDDVHRAPLRVVPVRAGASARLLHPHVPLDQAPDLALGVAAGDHALDELAMLFLRLAVALRAEGDHRQELLDLAEHAPLDHLPDL